MIAVGSWAIVLEIGAACLICSRGRARCFRAGFLVMGLVALIATLPCFCYPPQGTLALVRPNVYNFVESAPASTTWLWQGYRTMN